MIDISDKKIFENYLMETGLVSENDDFDFQYLEGGVSCVVALVKAQGNYFIVKQALRKLNVKEDWTCDPGRMAVEMKSNEVYYRLVPDNAPKVVSYDEKNNIFIREAAPESCRMWKSDLMGGMLDFKVASSVIKTLVTVHNRCAGDEQIAKDFSDKEMFYKLRIDAYFEFSLKSNPTLTQYAKPIIDELMNSGITLVHGDYSPKNVMLDEKKVFITDYEVSHYGHPCFDIGFLSNHLILKSIHMREFGGAFLSMLQYVLDIYFDEMNFMPKDELETSFVRVLPLLMIARVDGKSPVEYIVDPNVKEFVRKAAYAIVDEKITNRESLLKLLNKLVVGGYYEDKRNRYNNV